MKIPPWERFFLDIAAGLIIFGIFDFPWESRRLNLRIALSLGGVLSALVIAAVMLYQLRLVWLSVIGISIGMVLHVLIETGHNT